MDASRQGVRFVLQQQSETGQWTLVQAGYRFLTLSSCHRSQSHGPNIEHPPPR